VRVILERRHALIIIKNSKNEYLQYYDERWESYLFLNCKIEDQFDVDKIKLEVKEKLNANVIQVSYVMDKIHTKFSESDKVNKEYRHYFFITSIEKIDEEMLNKEFTLNNTKFKWYSYEELLTDNRVQKVNSDIVAFIKEIEEKSTSFKDYWNDEYWKKNLDRNKGKKLDFLEDLWLEKYADIINNIPKGKVLDLGCGLGQYTKYFLDKGFEVVSADISINALNKVKERIPEANIIQMDMSKRIPFDDQTFALVFANLSIHYFSEEVTKKLIKDVERILKSDGYFIGSVNSSKGFKYIENEAIKLEENYYFAEKRNVRLWDRGQFDEFFKDFKTVELREITTTRWDRIKYMWEFIFKK